MSSLLKRVEIPIFLTIVCCLLQVVPYYFYWKPLDDFATREAQWMNLVVAVSTFIGLISLMQVHGVVVQKRSKGWYFSIIVIVSAVTFAIIGLPLPEIGLGPLSYWYLFLYNNGQIALSQAQFSLLAFFMTSGVYRAFRARNVESALVLIAGILTICYNAPAIVATYPFFADIRGLLNDIPNLALNRAVTIGTALGTIILAVRTLLGIERGFLRGGGD
jgi:hypothetical protein